MAHREELAGAALTCDFLLFTSVCCMPGPEATKRNTVGVHVIQEFIVIQVVTTMNKHARAVGYML